jgi:8-oxo-dGTP pyrophosphatase MutT (NUDIX family)
MIQTISQLTSIRNFIRRASALDQTVKDKHLRLLRFPYVKDEGAKDHFCVYFAGIDIVKKKVFLGHHKKANIWIFNGGHLDKNETIEECLFREMEEEWGVPIQEKFITNHTRLSITLIDNRMQPSCSLHYDLWNFINLDSSRFTPDQKNTSTEFHEMKWLTTQLAMKIVKDVNTENTIDWLRKDVFI